ncbi:hypothetical protein ZHAS_00008379 [Anopheles sinensis]|uniref:Uncharacterized protein n=1 Tax=Anopheles sinensis TaxID=74873 RepID=A0A084VSB1_ANOSI|nr:hypothetical protein ZHAS_00008379 [Anopheles sinensis]
MQDFRHPAHHASSVEEDRKLSRNALHHVTDDAGPYTEWVKLRLDRFPPRLPSNAHHIQLCLCGSNLGQVFPQEVERRDQQSIVDSGPKPSCERVATLPA